MEEALWDDNLDDGPAYTRWLEKSSGRIFKGYELINLFGYETEKNIIDSGWFIPVFKESDTGLAKHFIELLDNNEYISNYIAKVIEEDDMSFFGAFQVFLENHDYPSLENKWFEFSDKIMLEKAKTWCKDNSIPYFEEYDPDRLLPLDCISACINGFADVNDVYNSLNDPRQALYYYSKKRHSFQLIDTITEENGWSSKEEIDSSDEYIYPPDIYLFEIIKSFMKDNCDENCSFLRSSSFSKEVYTDFMKWIDENDLTNKWSKYKNDYCLSTMINWCKENGIKYCIDSKKPEHCRNI